jgi:hypothetical protein
MALGAIFEVAGMTQAQYEQVKDRAAPGNQPAAGLIFHAAGPSETGWTVLEVWESREALDRLFREAVGPALQEIGLSAQPQFFEVVNTMMR